MSFANPWALLLLLLLIPVWLLYWLRPSVPRDVVGTGMFWQMALAEERFRARWLRWRTPVSLMLHSLTVILLALAAAGPEIPPTQRIVLILDNSATMRATDVQPSRFDAAKEAARRMIAGLRWCDQMAIFTTSPEPYELQSFTSDQALLRATVESKQLYGKGYQTRRSWELAQVDSAQAQGEPPAIEFAVKVAREIGPCDESLPPIGPNAGVMLTPGQLPRGKSPPRIILITDACSREAAREAEKSGVEVLRVGTAAGNRAITCFTARRSKIDAAQCEVFVEVRNHGNETAQGSLELLIDDKPGPSVPFAIEKDGRWQHLFEKLTLPAAARLTARIKPGDAYPFDDVAELQTPPATPKHESESGYPAPVASPPLPRSPDEKSRINGEGGMAALYRGSLLEDSRAANTSAALAYAEHYGPFYGEPNGVDIRVPSDIGRDASTLRSGSQWAPLWIVLGMAAAAILILEWCLYLRRWTS